MNQKKKAMTRSCRYCQGDIPDSYRKNRCYCSDPCSYAACQIRSKLQYQNLKKEFTEGNRIEKILQDFHMSHGSDIFIPAQHFENLNMNWALKPEDFIHEEFKGTRIGEYGYLIFDNNTIKIYKV